MYYDPSTPVVSMTTPPQDLSPSLTPALAKKSKKTKRQPLKLTADEVKDALRRRHPAFDMGMVGRWTCIEEWGAIDLLALDAWRSGDVVGYEVKVSRGDMRSELLDPTKRAQAVAMCTRFYFAVPAGLLTPEEREWEEPEWELDDFARPKCTNPQCSASAARKGFMRNQPKPRGSRLRGTEKEGVTVHLGHDVDRGIRKDGSTYTHHYQIKACCALCKGYGWTGVSKVEQVAPTLWVPRDVGLVVVGEGGLASVLKQAPKREITEPLMPWPYLGRARSRASESDASRLERQAINTFARWISARPDKRHLERALEHGGAINDIQIGSEHGEREEGHLQGQEQPEAQAYAVEGHGLASP